MFSKCTPVIEALTFSKYQAGIYHGRKIRFYFALFHFSHAARKYKACADEGAPICLFCDQNLAVL